MELYFQKSRLALAAMALVASVFSASAGIAAAADAQLELSGTHEVPPIQTKAMGQGTVTVGADKSVSGGVTTSNLAGTMAHIHEAAAGKNGPVIIPLTKKGDNEWMVPDGAKLTDEQYKSYEAGNLYVNVHSAAHKGGEIRAQIKP